MLQSLRITHFAIIDSLSIEFDGGFTALTGETGAGKSILVDAINLLLGARASADLIRTGEESATVEALFTTGPEAKRAAEEAGVELDGDELLVKRIVSRSGKNKVFLNGGPATLSMLESLGPRLIDIAGQHEHQSLLASECQRELLDAAAEHPERVRAMAAAYEAWTVARREAEELAAKDVDRARKEDYLRFQVAELARAELKEGEEERLTRERERLVHAEALAEATAKAEEALYSADGAVVERLKTIQGWIGQAARIAPELGALTATIDAARLELEEAARTLRDQRRAESDPERLAEVEDRLVTLDRLRKKHGVGAGEDGARALIRLHETLSAELAELESFESALAARRAAEAQARGTAEAAAAGLGKARRTVAKRLAGEIAAELKALGMAGTKFEIAVLPGELSRAGSDQVEFRIAPNPGEEPRALARIASGGELSRVMLALKCVLAMHHPVASYVFDEVDAGIGGAIAERVGKKLESIASDGKQVLCITHLPQIAALATSHLRVKKSVAGGRTATSLERLEENGREEELARMLGGVEITAATRAHAREMLEQGTQGGRRSVRLLSAARNGRGTPRTEVAAG